MFTALGEEHKARVLTLQPALEGSMQAGMKPVALWKLSRLVLESKLDVLHRSQTGEPADVESLRVVLKPDAVKHRVRTKPRCYSPENMAQLEVQMQQLVVACMVRQLPWYMFQCSYGGA